MKKKFRNLPKILKINEINKDSLTISVLFNNGENRILDFKQILTTWDVKSDDIEYKLYQPELFENIIIENDTLSWNKIHTYISTKEGKQIQVPFDVGADVLYTLSELDIERSFSLGKLLKKWRIQENLTQEELAQKSGTTRTYITKIENDKQDIEIKTFMRIVEAGLGKKLKISIE
ncbi:MAG: helix-turn-helix transcriptional regulator [Crocinitomicaceae bacterium]|jgi:DNA-binding XRE family transcriptional regulator|nr:helix-turn-helix transcriptional regulator [Crocinitomicaceae bacterium]